MYVVRRIYACIYVCMHVCVCVCICMDVCIYVYTVDRDIFTVKKFSPVALVEKIKCSEILYGEHTSVCMCTCTYVCEYFTRGAS